MSVIKKYVFWPENPNIWKVVASGLIKRPKALKNWAAGLEMGLKFPNSPMQDFMGSAYNILVTYKGLLSIFSPQTYIGCFRLVWGVWGIVGTFLAEAFRF